MALTQQKQRVAGVLGSPPEVPVGVFFQRIEILEVSEGSRGVRGGSFGVRGVRESPGRAGEVPGRSGGCPGGALGILHFGIVRGLFVNGPKKY